MNAIVSVTSDWGIGLKGRLLVPNREDMRYFVRMTMGGTVICGRKTFESFPGGPLKGRRNIVLTSDRNYAVEGVEVVHSISEVLEAVANDDPDATWLIGGATVYSLLLDECSHAYVTKHDVMLPCDARFPNLDDDSSWCVSRRLPGGVTPDGVSFEFLVYERLR